MPRAIASTIVPGPANEVEALFQDISRWPTWVDGFAHLVREEGEWPGEGAAIVWQSRPGGRGRVAETVTAYVPGTTQTRRVEDESLVGTQVVHFETAGERVRVTLSLEFAVKRRTVLGPLTGFFVRRAIADSLRRTLGRLAAERDGDLSL